jgi:hypothetical protein
MSVRPSMCLFCPQEKCSAVTGWNFRDRLQSTGASHCTGKSALGLLWDRSHGKLIYWFRRWNIWRCLRSYVYLHFSCFEGVSHCIPYFIGESISGVPREWSPFLTFTSVHHRNGRWCRSIKISDNCLIFTSKLNIFDLSLFFDSSFYNITNLKVAGSDPDEVDFFNWPNPSSRTMALVSAQPLTQMITRNILGMFLGVKGGRRVRLTTLPPSMSLCLKNVGTSTSHNPMGLHGLLQG